MRKRLICVPMMTLLLLLAACGGEKEASANDLRVQYQEMSGCVMEAVIRCDQNDTEWEAVLRCDYVPGGESSVEVLEPETIAGVKAIFHDTDWLLEYEGDTLNAGALSREMLSPAVCLPRLMDALQEGWLLEENEETWGGIPCVRLALDQSGSQDGKIVSVVWLRTDNGTPLRGEIAVGGEIILTAEFTEFVFYDTMNEIDKSGQAG